MPYGNLGYNILTLRKLNRLSQEQLTEKIGISRQTVAKWENGETLPDIKSCFEIAKIFNISLDDLLEYKTKDAGLKKQIPNKNFKNNNFLKPPKGKHIFGAVTLGEKGQIIIPKAARDIFNLKCGDRLICLGDENQGLAFLKESDMLEFYNEVMLIYRNDKTDES